MEFQKIINRAMGLRRQYEQREQQLFGSPSTSEDVAQGFFGDVNNVVKLVQAEQGKRSIANTRQQLESLLAHSLWSVIVLAKMHEIDLEQSFFEAMDRLEAHLLETD